MAPVHDTDLAQDRWQKEQWRNFELWEQIEQRQKLVRRRWISGTAILFLCIFAVPVSLDKGPKWLTQRAARIVADEIIRIQALAVKERAPYRVSIVPGQALIRVDKVKSCDPQDLVSSPLGGARLTSLVNPYFEGQVVGITQDQAKQLGLLHVAQSYCFDPLKGGFFSGVVDQNLAAIGLGYVKDLAHLRSDRASLVYSKQESAEIAFE